MLPPDLLSICHKTCIWITAIKDYFEQGIHQTSPTTLTWAEAKSAFRAAHFGPRNAKNHLDQEAKGATLPYPTFVKHSKRHSCEKIGKAKEEMKLSFANIYQNNVTAKCFHHSKEQKHLILWFFPDVTTIWALANALQAQMAAEENNQCKHKYEGKGLWFWWRLKKQLIFPQEKHWWLCMRPYLSGKYTVWFL